MPTEDAATQAFLQQSTADDDDSGQRASLQGEVTELLIQISEGHPEASATLMPLVYAELRRIARSYMRRERKDHTLQATALVHEAYLRMLGQNRVAWKNRGHFLSVAATMMRRILVDSSREQTRVKRGSGAVHDELHDGRFLVQQKSLGPEEILALNEGLERLARHDPRMVHIVELRFFAGFNMAETAAVLGVSEPTIKRNWSVARAWLAREMGGA